MSYSKKKLIEWLEMSDFDDSNKQILLALVKNTPIGAFQGDVDQILPYILVELTDEETLLPAKKILKEELLKSKDTDFQLFFLKDKMGLISDEVKGKVLGTIKREIDYCILTRRYNLSTAYKLLFFCENSYPDQNDESVSKVLAEVIPALIVNASKNYKLQELCVFTQALTSLNHNVGQSFLNDLLFFLEDQQHSLGYFGYTDPFIERQVLAKKLAVIDSFYMYVTIEKLRKLVI